MKAATEHLVRSVAGVLVGVGVTVLAGVLAFGPGPRPAADLLLAAAVAATLLLLARSGATLATIAIECDHDDRQAAEGGRRRACDDRIVRVEAERGRARRRGKARRLPTTTTTELTRSDRSHGP